MKICKDKILGTDCEICCCECDKLDCSVRCEEPHEPCDWKIEEIWKKEICVNGYTSMRGDVDAYNQIVVRYSTND